MKCISRLQGRYAAQDDKTSCFGAPLLDTVSRAAEGSLTVRGDFLPSCLHEEAMFGSTTSSG